MIISKQNPAYEPAKSFARKSLICFAGLPAGGLRASRSKAFKAAAKCRNGWHCGHLRLFGANDTILILIFFVFFMGVGPFCVLAAEKQEPLLAKHSMFVVETDSESASESLERISGQIDLGFSAPDDSFESSNHYKPGPFGRQDSAEKDTP